MPRWAQHPGLTLCWANHPCTLPACLGWPRHPPYKNPPCTAAARTAAARGLALPLRAGPGAGKARGKLTSGNRRQAACPRWRGTGRTPCPPAHAQRVTPYTSTRNLAALGQQQGRMVADLFAWRARCRGWRQVLSRLGIGLLPYQQAEAAGMANAGLGGVVTLRRKMEPTMGMTHQCRVRLASASSDRSPRPWPEKSPPYGPRK